MDPMSIVIGVVIGIVVGFVVGFVMLKSKTSKAKEDAEKEAKRILDDAHREGESIKKSKQLEAKEVFVEKKSEFESLVGKRNKKLDDRENNLKDREAKLNKWQRESKQKEQEVQVIKENLTRQVDLIESKKAEIEKQQGEHRRKLEKIARITEKEAKDELIESLKQVARTESMAHVKEIVDEAKLKANKEAKKIVIQTIQRTAAEQAIENTVSVFNLESDDQKGQIIGREGRNIRALEAATGVEIIVDDTPEAIIISGYDPVRRETARLSLQRLVTDGRIHPARIEEVVAKTKSQLEEQMMEIGERTVIELGIHGLHRELVRIVGKMRFRSSYGQNLLQHSKETARMCATMASELGLNVKLAKRAGLLHDIGKVIEEPDLSHAIAGMQMCEKYGEKAAVVNAVGAHHDEIEMTFAISPIVQACDAISGSRPGARRETLESYMQRIKELEHLASDYKGVQKAYAMQAGRELRVIVEAEKVTDGEADNLAFEISDKIQNEMTYPGQIKVTVIRERRAVSYAK